MHAVQTGCHLFLWTSFSHLFCFVIKVFFQNTKTDLFLIQIAFIYTFSLIFFIILKGLKIKIHWNVIFFWFMAAKVELFFWEIKDTSRQE